LCSDVATPIDIDLPMVRVRFCASWASLDFHGEG